MRPYPKPTPKKKSTTPKIKPGKRKCKNCGEKFQKKLPLQACCGIECAAEYARKQGEKRRDREYRKWRREKKEKLKTIADWKNDLQKEINWICRHLDKDLPCISHPDTKGFLRYDAGHMWGVKAHSDLRFNLHNLHKQNSNANERWGGGAEYAKGLAKRYGPEYLEMVLGLPLRWKGIGKEKFKVDKIREEYLPAARRVVRELKAGADLDRDQINELIGIYV